ncbi:MAG: hypothetical protein E6Q97_01100 [Desulfurellales bacterium]|nr:MAG: hypothetical protein E6Q97_01100 [Desulfurellales bacterium]
MIQRWDDLTPEEQARYEDREKLLAQLAAVTQRAEAAEVALALATNSTPGKGTGVWVPLDKWQELQDRLLALQVDAGTLVRLRDDTDNILWSLKPENVPGAINWGDLGTRETQEIIDEQRRWYRVIIEEADPVNPDLHAAVLASLVALGWKADDVEIETAW